MKKFVIILLVVIIILSCIIFLNKNNKNVWETKKEITTDFEIIFNESKNLGKNRIISKNIFIKNSYNIYSYEGNVKIKIEGIEHDFKEALVEKKITINDILYKAEEDAKNKLVKTLTWNDGGTVIYKYDTYSIIKFNKIGGSKDFYIGATYINYSIEE